MLSDLAFALAERGDRVSVITSRQRYDDADAALVAHENIGGVDIHRVATTRFGRHALLGRAVDYLTFYATAAWKLWRIARKGDVVVAKTDPPMLSVIAAPVAWARGVPLVNWLQDIFPEVAIASGLGKSRLFQLICRGLGKVRTWTLRSAIANVVLGERMASKVERLGVAPGRITIIPNWADGTLIKPVAHEENDVRKAWKLSAGDFVVGYSGNLGRTHDFRTILDAISLIERGETAHASSRKTSSGATGPRANSAVSQPRIIWLFIGGGAGYRQLKDEVRRRGLSTVQFHDYHPRKRLADSLSAADVHLVSLNPELEGLIVPSKYYGIAAAGRPAIFIGDREGEIAQVLARDKSGLAVSLGDGETLAELVLQLAADPDRAQTMGRNARAAFLAHYDVGLSVQRWIDLLEGIAGGAAMASRSMKTLEAVIQSESDLR